MNKTFMNKEYIKRVKGGYYMDKKRLYAGMVSVISYLVPDIMGDSKFRRFIHAK